MCFCLFYWFTADHKFFLLTFCQQLIYKREKQADKMKNYAINDITSLDGMHVYLMVYLLWINLPDFK